MGQERKYSKKKNNTKNNNKNKQATILDIFSWVDDHIGVFLTSSSKESEI